MSNNHTLSKNNEPKNLHSGHRLRLKNRFLKEGLKDFEAHNILELLLFYSIPQGDVNDTAHELINRFGSLSAVFNADFEDLINVKGIKEHTATMLKLIPELAREYHNDLFKSLKNKENFDLNFLSNYLIKLFAGKKNEEVYLLCFDNQNILRLITFLQAGNKDSLQIDIKTIAQCTLRGGYEKIALAHNHPDGTALPSIEDIESTRRLKKGLSFCGIELCEHFIVSGDQCVGMFDWKGNTNERKSDITD